MEQELNLEDPEKTESYEKKTGTFRSNSLKWIASKPGGRLICFRMIVKIHQFGLRKLHENASRAAKLQELVDRRSGKELDIGSFRRLKVVIPNGPWWLVLKCCGRGGMGLLA